MDRDFDLYVRLNYDLNVLEDIDLDVRIPRRYIRDMESPLDFFNDLQFKQRYRFSKETFATLLLPLLNNVFGRHSARGLPIPPIICLAVALRFYATGNFQTVTGDLRGVSQPTISRIVKIASRCIAEQSRIYIKFPTEENRRRTHNQFYSIAQFPRVSGTIDCSHIKIKRPPGDMAEVFRNRKGYFSFNVQVVSGPNLEIYDIVARWPGREHDSMIFNNSSVKMRFEQRRLEGYLLGDSGYACLPYLLTPLLHPQTEPERRYNRSHIRTRNTVERLFGVWKRRFPCLQRGIGNKLESVPLIIVACAVLYNIGIIGRDLWEADEVPAEEEQQLRIPQIRNNLGQATRRRIIEQYFS